MVSSRIDGSGEARCSKDGRCGGGDGHPVELLSSRSVSVMVRLALALLWSLWRWCSGAPAAGARCSCCLYSNRPRSVIAGCSSSGVLDAEDGGSFSCFSSSTSAVSGGVRFQGVRGVSPAVVVQHSSSRRPCARRVSPLVPQMMLPWSLGVGFVRFAAPDLLFLCLFSGLCGVGRLVGLVMLFFVI